MQPSRSEQASLAPTSVPAEVRGLSPSSEEKAIRSFVTRRLSDGFVRASQENPREVLWDGEKFISYLDFLKEVEVGVEAYAEKQPVKYRAARRELELPECLFPDVKSPDAQVKSFGKIHEREMRSGSRLAELRRFHFNYP